MIQHFSTDADVSFILLLLLVCNSVCCRLEPQIALRRHSNGTLSINGSIQLDELCSQLPDGTYPDYTQACRMFFICSRGKKVATFWCTKGFVFSLTSGHCEPPDRAMCPDYQNPSVLDEVISFHVDDEECRQGDGVYPNFAEGCSSFHVCRDGLKATFKCPESSLYDWRTKSCRTSNSLSCNLLTCDNREDGIYIDSNSYCKRYFECRRGNITEYICPEGTIYNARQHRCTRSSITRCHGLETVQCTGLPDGYYPDFSTDCKVFGLCMNGGLKTYNCPAKTLFDASSLTCETHASCPKLNINKCVGKNNGIHPDFQSGCRDFYLCLDGLLTHQGSCPQGKLLNPLNGNCQPFSLVTCSPIVDTDCDGLPDGVYPDYDTGCSAYFICLNQRRVSTAYCSGTDLYDIATGKCLPSSFVVCRDHSSFVSAPRLFDSYNCDNRLGIFPEFSSDCKRYATCAYGQLKFYECKDGTYFDSETNSCKEKINNCKAPFAIATFQCLPGDDGIYVSANCSEWHECRNGVGFTNICPKGLQYNIQLGKCIERSESCFQDNVIQRRVFQTMNVAPIEVNDSSFNCPNLNGVLGDSSHCRKFHFCIDGRKTSYLCPLNFSYDAKTQSCVNSRGSNMCQDPQERTSNNQNSFSCAHLEDGMYEDYSSDCRRYFVCENGKSIPVYCPERQKFNSVKMMCDKEEYVRCLPASHYISDLPLRKQNRQTDDVYHVFRPEDLYTETYTYLTRKNPPVTKASDSKSRVWDDYDIYLPENTSQSSTDNSFDLSNSKVPNTIHIESSTKRQQPSKHISNPIQSDNTKITSTVTNIYEDEVSNNSTKLEHIDMQSREFDAACRKGDTGFFPDYSSGCKMFHICFKTIRKTYSCPSVLLFNPETKNCDLPENVFCTRPEPIIEESFDCRGRMNQFVPDYASGCKHYIGCINNLPYRFMCPKGKIFSLETSICEPESTSVCEYPLENNSTQREFQERVGERILSHRHVHSVPGQFYFTCIDKPDGFYPDYKRHCHVFYRCVRGKKFSHYCKQGLLFNPDSGICDFEENVKCLPNNGTEAQIEGI
ncbi:uncharacterized protein TNIN_414531 [Trichonephila inaurata madagascariensis]|uniref:Chitin-binding type-2 domain-containing protein n=1 Tax=Trichonephila inaurata madagascariensis TaxID=2747483 RepID=A0A8X6YUY6_9ARAC|nr:uncharacterized protein TNIN_414531 [Trichonephila inaurata madagascariensis]